MSARRWAPPAVWAALILLLTSIPGADLPRLDVHLADKMVHSLMYAVFAWLSVRAMLRTGQPWWIALLVLVGVSLFGAVDEWHQQFIPGRSMELLDWIADTLGAAVGAGAATILPMRRERRA